MILRWTCTSLAAAALLAGCGNDDATNGLKARLPELADGQERAVAGYLSGGVAGFCDGIAVARNGAGVTTACGVDGISRHAFTVDGLRLEQMRSHLARIDAAALSEAQPCPVAEPGVVDGMSAYFEIEGVGPICSGAPAITALVGETKDLLLENAAGRPGTG